MNNSDYTGSNSEHTYSLQADFITKSSASIRIEQRRRRQALRRRTSLAALICIAVIIASLSAVIVEAADSNSSALTSDTRYYTSITIEKDDTLWSIASLYAPEGVDTGRYVNDIRQVNNLHNDTITAGCSLIIYYYAGE